MINNQKTFSKRAALDFAFEALKNHFAILSLITILIFGVYFFFSLKEFPELINSIINKTPSKGNFETWILVVSQVVFLPSFCAVALKIYDKAKPDFKDTLPKFSAIWKLLVICLLGLFAYLIVVFIAIIFGFISALIIKSLLSSKIFALAGIILLPLFFLFFIIALTYLYLKLKLFVFAIINNSLNPFEALKQSWQITKGNTFNLFVLQLIIHIIPAIILVLFMLTAIAQRISISTGQIFLAIYYILYFFAFAISVLADAYIYRQLEPAKEV